ncbi:hypothetical protein SEVIR_9G563500v4 [Setaria viridis]|uniref:PPPDE domain-containing protein n=3 Tax=Setaria TaxID=4554 RepID=K4AK66_SETIT|nr:deSI-like protein At4g17486 [Setaria italica]RCV46787.1 hypothetical protein SETIT_9G559500v2 [Setaria italica]TKV98495.1 hypothetical protein SEVIR_9G563500v2 [Setaria viridis]
MALARAATGSGPSGEREDAGEMSSASTSSGREVVLHVYEITKTGYEKTDKTIRMINRFFKDGIGVGGIFHSAVQVYGEEEWSYGFRYCDTGVFSCPVGQNSMYTYRESIVLGVTTFSNSEVKQILIQLSCEWPGFSYDFLSRNCNHFTNEFCEKLGARKIPGWVNRFANAGYTANVVAENTALQFRQAKSDIVNASKAAYNKLTTGLGQNNQDKAETPTTNQKRSTPWFQGNWFKAMVSAGAKPSTRTTNFSREAGDGPK